jgi:hypothetical protein
VPFGADEDGFYESPLLPKFKIHVPTLWHDKLPNFIEIGEFVKAMFTD